MEVRRDGKLLFAADAPLEIRHVRFQEGRTHAEVRAAKTAKLRGFRFASRDRTGVRGLSARSLGPGEMESWR